MPRLNSQQKIGERRPRIAPFQSQRRLTASGYSWDSAGQTHNLNFRRKAASELERMAAYGNKPIRVATTDMRRKAAFTDHLTNGYRGSVLTDCEYTC